MSGSAFSAPSSLDLTMAVFSLSSNPNSDNGLGMRDFDMNRLPSEMEEDGPTGSVEDDEEGCAPRKKLRLTKEQSRLLEASFRENQTLNPKQKEALAQKLNLRSRQVEVWFQNRRARTKLKQTEMECEYLKRCFGSLTEENRRLQREVEELRALRVAPPTVISPHSCEPLPAATLTMCPCCERVSSSAMEKTAPPLSFTKPSIFPSRQYAALLTRALPFKCATHRKASTV